MSPLTTETVSSLPSLPQKKKLHRKSPKQASVARCELKELNDEYTTRYKTAFKEATNLVANANLKPVDNMTAKVNARYNLDGNQQVAKSTVYRAVKKGLAGKSPPKKGLPPNIPSVLLKAIATHVEVLQVGEGELKGRDIKQLIGASIKETVFENTFKVETAWKKLRVDFPQNPFKPPPSYLLRMPKHHGQHTITSIMRQPQLPCHRP